MSKSQKSRLGRGLGAIISGGAVPKSGPSPAPAVKPGPAASARPGARNDPPPATESAPAVMPGYREIPVAQVDPNPYQPRRDFRPEQIEELAESIRAEGLLQPVVVRAANGRYQLIAGERRWRAFQLLKLRTIPARVVEAGNASAATMALIENLQREGLNPVEEAHGYASLIRDFDLTQEQVADRVGKGRATIANSLRLINLGEELQGYLATGLLSPGHAKVLLGIDNAQEQIVLARRVIEQGLSVRATETLVASWQKGSAGRKQGGRVPPAAEAAAIADIEKRFSSFLQARVELKHARKKGRIVIEYQGNEELQRILDKLGVGS